MNPTRYSTVAKDLMQAIASGRYPVGSLLPTEFELCDLYNVSRHTVRAAIDQLLTQGLVSRRKRVGTRVEASSPRGGYSQSLASVADLAHLADTQQREIQNVRHFVADLSEAARLGLVPGSITSAYRASASTGSTLPRRCAGPTCMRRATTPRSSNWHASTPTNSLSG